MINATMCFLRKANRTLLLYRHRGEEDIHNGFYVPPGGRTERGERGIDSILREFREETGLTLVKPRLKVIATFYNEGRKFEGQKALVDDWCVEVYEANEFTGKLRKEHPKAKPLWVPDAELPNKRIYPGDRKILELLTQPGVFQVLVKYNQEELVRFDYLRVDQFSHE